MEPVIEFKDFSFKYRAQTEPTLRDINLSIMPGEKVLIVGPSGSGKSTLAHCINGLAPFSYPGDMTGTLRVDGKDPAKLGLFGISQIVGTVLQDTDSLSALPWRRIWLFRWKIIWCPRRKCLSK